MNKNTSRYYNRFNLNHIIYSSNVAVVSYMEPFQRQCNNIRVSLSIHFATCCLRRAYHETEVIQAVVGVRYEW